MKIFIVEDDDSDFGVMKWVLSKDNPEIVRAKSPEETRRLFQENHTNIDMIIMDGCLGSMHDKPDTLELVNEIRKSGYEGPIIAASSYEPYNDLIMKAGATHSAGNDGKIRAALLAREITKDLESGL